MNEWFYFTEHNTQIFHSSSSVASVRSVGCFVCVCVSVGTASFHWLSYTAYIVKQTTTCMDRRAVYHFGK